MTTTAVEKIDRQPSNVINNSYFLKMLSNSDVLDYEFVASYIDKPVAWGPVGYVTYARTYARPVPGLKRNEEWVETITRCIEGIQSLARQSNQPQLSKDEAHELFDHMFNLRCLVSGRALWQLGTDTVKRIGAASLVNCWCTVMDDIESFCFLFDMLMLGGGVGFVIRREDVAQLPKVHRSVNVKRNDANDADFIVPDKREGWVELLRKVLNAYFVTGESFDFSMHCIRSKGAPIKGFGGKASGPDDFAEGIEHICKVLKSRAGKRLRPIDVYDIATMIGNIVVAGNVRRCLPKGTRVHAKRGMVPIEEINVGDEVLTSCGYRKVKNKFEQGKQSLLKIITQDGEFECTPNHKMAVLDAINGYVWKEAQQLNSGDRLISSREPIEGEAQVLPSWAYEKPRNSTTCQDIKIPLLDAGIAWLLGLIQADGYVWANRQNNGFNAYVSICLGEGEEDLRDRAVEQLQRFGVKVSWKKKKGEKAYDIRATSKQLAWYLDEHFKKPKTTLRVPECIYRAPLDIRKSYLVGVMDGDGAYNNRTVQIATTCYFDFAKDLQRLAYSCGFETRINTTDASICESRENYWKNLYHVVLTNHAKDALFDCSQAAREPRRSTVTRYSNGFPSDWLFSVSAKEKRRLGVATLKQITVDRASTAVSLEVGCPVEVKQVIPGRIDETWDIEVEDMHEFFADGLLTHNSAEIAVGDPDDREYIRAKRWDIKTVPSHFAMANNTVEANSFEVLDREFWIGYEADPNTGMARGENYGLFNKELSMVTGRLGENKADPTIVGLNPCGEQILPDQGACNLSNIILPNIENKKQLFRICELLLRYNKIVAMAPYHWKKAERTIHEQCRIGISVDGVAMLPDDRWEWLDDAYSHIVEYDKEISDKYGYPLCIRYTTVKPSGTQALLPNCTPGIHAAYAQYVIRRIRIASNSDIAKVCKEHGYYCEPKVNFDGTLDHNTLVFDFPVKVPEGTLLAENETVVDQLERMKKAQTKWSDSAVSITVYYKPEELDDIKAWLKENYETSVKSISFLRHAGHGFQQAPYEPISKEQYEEMVAKVRPIQSCTVAYSEEDAQLLDSSCEGGACGIR